MHKSEEQTALSRIWGWMRNHAAPLGVVFGVVSIAIGLVALLPSGENKPTNAVPVASCYAGSNTFIKHAGGWLEFHDDGALQHDFDELHIDEDYLILVDPDRRNPGASQWWYDELVLAEPT